MAERRKERKLGTGLGALQGALPGSTDPAAAPQQLAADPAQGKKGATGGSKDAEALKGATRPRVDTVSGPKQPRGGQQAGSPAPRSDRSQGGGQGPRGGQQRPPAGDAGPARAPRQDRRELQDPSFIPNARLRPDMQHPGDYMADVTNGPKTLHVRVVGARYIPADQLPQPRNLRLVTEPVAVQGGRRGEYTARAVIDGDTPDLAAIESLEHVPAEAFIGSTLETGASTIERIDADYFQVSDPRDDGRVVRIRSLFGWKPKEISGAGVHMLDLPTSDKGMECVVVSGGEGSTSYEAIPLWESTMLTSYAKLVDILMRYKGVIAAYQDPQSLKFANGSEIAWTGDDVVAERKSIAEHLYAAIGGCIELAGEGVTSGAIPNDLTLWQNAQKLHNLEEMLVGLSPNLRIPLPKQYAPTPISAMRSYPDRAQLITELRPLLEVGLSGMAAVASDDDIRKMVSALDKGLMEMSNVQIGQYLRGGEGFVKLQNAITEIRIAGRPVSISPESHFAIRGKLEGAGPAAHLVDLSADLPKDTRIAGIRVVGDKVVFDTPKDMARLETELQRLATDARSGTKQEVDVTLGNHQMTVAEFVDLIRKGQITVEAPREGTKFERLIHQLDAATAQEAVGYFNGVAGGIQFATGYIEVRNGNRTADGRVAFEQVRGMLNTKFTGWVNTVFAAEGIAVDQARVSARQADEDSATVEVDLIVGGQNVGTVALTGDMARDQRVLAGSIAGIRERRGAAEKAVKEGRAAKLYSFVETGKLDLVVGYVNGDVLTDVAIPIELRSYRDALRDAEVGAMLRGKIFDRVRVLARLPEDVRFDIAGRDPLTLTVTFGDGRTERMVVTGAGAQDNQEFGRVRAAITAERARMEEAARGEPTRALYAFLDTNPLPQVIDYVGGDPLTNVNIPAELRVFRSAARHTEYGSTIREKVLARVREYIALPNETQMNIVGNDPLTVAVYSGEGAVIARIELTGIHNQDEAAFEQLRRATKAEEERVAREVAPETLLEQFSRKYDIVPSLRLGERFIVRAGNAIPDMIVGNTVELTSMTRGSHFEGGVIQFTRIGGIEPVVGEVESYDFPYLLGASGSLERARLAVDNAYVTRSLSVYEEAREGRDVTAAEALAVAGVPYAHIAGRDVYRFRLGANIEGDRGEVLLRAGTQYRITGRNDREQTVTIAPEDVDGIITSSSSMVMDYSRLLGDPQMLEVPSSNFFLDLASRLNIPSPEVARDMFSGMSGTFEITVRRMVPNRKAAQGAPTEVERDVVIVLSGLSLRRSGDSHIVTYTEQGAAARVDMPAAEFLSGVEAGRVRIREIRAADLGDRVRKIAPVVERTLERGSEIQYRFQERVRRIVSQGDLDVEDALRREHFVFQPEDEYAREQRITLVSVDWTAGTLTLRYGGSEHDHTITTDAFAAALSGGAFKYSLPYRESPSRRVVVEPSWEDDSESSSGPASLAPTVRPAAPRALPSYWNPAPELAPRRDVSPDAETVRASGRPAVLSADDLPEEDTEDVPTPPRGIPPRVLPDPTASAIFTAPAAPRRADPAPTVRIEPTPPPLRADEGTIRLPELALPPRPVVATPTLRPEPSPISRAVPDVRAFAAPEGEGVWEQRLVAVRRVIREQAQQAQELNTKLQELIQRASTATRALSFLKYRRVDAVLKDNPRDWITSNDNAQVSVEELERASDLIAQSNREKCDAIRAIDPKFNMVLIERQ